MNATTKRTMSAQDVLLIAAMADVPPRKVRFIVKLAEKRLREQWDSERVDSSKEPQAE